MRSLHVLYSRVASLLMLALGIGCNGFTPGQDVIATDTSLSCSTQLGEADIDQRGGRVELQGDARFRGAYLSIPAQAVSRPTHVRLSVGSDLHVDGTPNSPAVCVKSDQAQFEHPVLLVLPYDQKKLQGRSPRYLAMGASVLRNETPTESLLDGLILVDEPNQLAGAEIDRPGIFQIVNIGTGSGAISAKLSVLFAIDNSGSMTPKQRMLHTLYPEFFKKVTHWDDLNPEVQPCVQYNIGVLTTDMGSDENSFGQNGQLQSQFCDPTRGSIGAQDVCKNAACNTVTPLGTHRYIHRGDFPESMQEKQFHCIAEVGDAGSGVEQPLESLDRALKSDPDVSKKVDGFFRPDSLNAVVFVTDEGDCSFDSTPMNANRHNFYSPPASCADSRDPGCYADLNQRCLGVALKCDHPINTTMDTKMEHCKYREDLATDPVYGSTVLKSPTTYANNLKTFMKSLNLMDADTEGRLYVRGLWPEQQDPWMMRPMTLPTEFAFQMNVANRPPSNTLGKDAFCYDPASLLPMAEPILGHPQGRLDAFAQAIVGLAGPGALSKAEVGSICDKSDRDHLLDDLADAIIKNRMYCPTHLAP